MMLCGCGLLVACGAEGRSREAQRQTEAKAQEPHLGVVGSQCERIWHFSRVYDGLKDFSEAEASANRVPAGWALNEHALHLEVVQVDADAWFEKLWVRDLVLGDVELDVRLTAQELSYEPSLLEDRPESRRWSDRPAGGGVFWHAKGDDGYAALCDVRNGRLELYEFRSDGPALLESVETGTVACRLQVSMRGGEIRASVGNGAEVVHVPKSPLPPGHVGLIAYGASEPAFAEFSVRYPCDGQESAPRGRKGASRREAVR